MVNDMKDKASLLMRQIDEKYTEINHAEILKICMLDINLPKSNSDVYFLIKILMTLGVFEKQPKSKFLINWENYHKLIKEGNL